MTPMGRDKKGQVMGRSPKGSGSRPAGRASKAVSPVPASIPSAEFDDGAGVAYTISKLREELDELYRREPPVDAPKIRPGKLHHVGVSVISHLQQIDHLQRYQIACLEYQLSRTLNPPKHRFWGAGEPDCPREIKAGNGELHTLRCKVCGQDDPRDDFCRSASAIEARRAASEAAVHESATSEAGDAQQPEDTP